MRGRIGHKRTILDSLHDTASVNGDIAAAPFFRSNAVLVAHPDFVGHVLHRQRDNYERGLAGHWLRKFWGEGLVLSDGDKWLLQRRLIGPAFQSGRIEQLVGWMEEEIRASMRDWDRTCKSGQAVNLTYDIWNLTLRILLRSLIGGKNQAVVHEIVPLVDSLLGHANAQMPGVIPQRFAHLTPRSLMRRYGARNQLIRWLSAIIQDRCRQPTDYGDILSSLVLAQDQGGGSGQDAKWILDQLMSLLLAGRESTATSMVWACYLLARHAEAQKALAGEVARILNGRPPATADLGSLNYLKAVVDETLRLYPPAYKFTRQAKQADVIGGYDIHAGDVIILSPWVTHRHRDIWDTPESFNPNRFLGSGVDDLPKFSYFPFGAGPRLCAGRSFAQLELHTVLAFVVQRYRLELAHPGEVKPKAVLTLQPECDIWMKMHPRP